MKKITLTLGCLALLTSAGQAFTTVGFGGLTPSTTYAGSGGGAYYNGSDGAGSFTSGGVQFTNNYNTTYGSWNGWAYSNTTDTTTAGFGNQYSAYTGGGFGSDNDVYAVNYPSSVSPTVTLGANTHTPLSMRITNTTYAADSMLNGNSYAKKFGGGDGNYADWFLLTIRGFDTSNQEIGTVDFYLADYRFADNSEDYIVNNWELVDLRLLGSNLASLQFEYSSSDIGEWGMNTPAYFAMDDFAAVPEPSAYALLAGLFTLAAVALRRRR
tara:strand:+ start:1311 stop:2117 length:807 start_codon:yes stop_codon:yes gene_type:complete